MKVAFRADASLQMGTGHVMRCLTLANALAARGAECHFICRALDGNLIEHVRAMGHRVHALPVVCVVRQRLTGSDTHHDVVKPAHSHWLGATQAQDIDACAPILAVLRPDWLIVDHYALDASWERALAPNCDRLMVIDDLADRPHAGDLLLDQTFGRADDDYRTWLPAHCKLLCGSRYALLRPEFAALRPYSLQRRALPQLRHLLISMGGVDKDNHTGQVLAALYRCELPTDCDITVVIGATAPWRAEVERKARSMPWPTRVRVGVSDMAQLMADSDFAIGAAGATSWERCCLGVPTVMLVLANNQRRIAQELSNAGAADLFDVSTLKNQSLIRPELLEPQVLASMSDAAAAITDGFGVARIIETLTDKVQHANQPAV